MLALKDLYLRICKEHIVFSPLMLSHLKEGMFY